MKKIEIAFVGCSKTKTCTSPSGYTAARDLYTSDLFRKRVEYVERKGMPWYILSAKSGLISPTVALRNYNETLADLSCTEIAEWHLDVANSLMTELIYEFKGPKLSDVTIEFHAGSRYCEPLGSILKIFGVNIRKPVANLGIGKQLAFYSEQNMEATNEVHLPI